MNLDSCFTFLNQNWGKTKKASIHKSLISYLFVGLDDGLELSPLLGQQGIRATIGLLVSGDLVVPGRDNLLKQLPSARIKQD